MPNADVKGVQVQRTSSTIVGGLALALLIQGTAHAADVRRESGNFGASAVHAGVTHDPGTTSNVKHDIYTRSTGTNVGFYNATVTGERCDGNGQNCGFVDQQYYALPVDDYFFFFLAPVQYHTYRTRGSWNDGLTDARYINAVSPLVS